MLVLQQTNPGTAFLETLGQPQRTYGEQQRRASSVMMVISAVFGFLLAAGSALFLLALMTSTANESKHSGAVLVIAFCLFALPGIVGGLMMFLSWRSFRNGRTTFALYPERLVRFNKRRWNEFGLSEISRIEGNGERGAVIRMCDGTKVDVSRHVENASELVSHLSACLRQSQRRMVPNPVSTATPSCVAGRSRGFPARSAGDRQIGNRAASVSDERPLYDRDALVARLESEAAQEKSVRGIGETEEAKDSSSWEILCGGIFLLVASAYLVHVFGQLESGERESARLWWVFALLYNTFGSTLTIGLTTLAGVVMTFFGLNDVLSSKRDKPVYR
ncbi:MAG: hypothetical protein R3C19_21565 [Planctomycetaceae bacterium]